MAAKRTHKLEIGRGVHDKPGALGIVYLNDFRISGGKPWGGFVAEKTYTFSDDDLKDAIRRCSVEMDQQSE